MRSPRPWAACKRSKGGGVSACSLASPRPVERIATAQGDLNWANWAIAAPHARSWRRQRCWAAGPAGSEEARSWAKGGNARIAMPVSVQWLDGACWHSARWGSQESSTRQAVGSCGQAGGPAATVQNMAALPSSAHVQGALTARLRKHSGPQTCPGPELSSRPRCDVAGGWRAGLGLSRTAGSDPSGF